MAAPGRLVSFEGIDGSGKSTQARLLADRLRGLGHRVTLTREPGGSPGAEQIRRLLTEGAADRWSAETEVLLFTAARRDHLERTIRPALDRGEVVITDRFADSTRVYQGLAQGLGRDDLRALVDRLHALLIGVEPGVTVLIDIDPGIGLKRAVARATAKDGAAAETRFEDMGAALQARLRQGFLDLARGAPRFLIVDGARPAEEVAEDVVAGVLARWAT
jgi:dTMP kinase